MNKPNYEISSTVHKTFNLSRLVEQELVAGSVDIDFTLDITGEGDPALHLRCIRWWLDNVLDQSIAYSVTTEAPIDTLNWVRNNVIMCPDDPTDWLLLVLICAKINAIGSGCVEVASAHLESSTSHGFGTTFVGDPLEILPANEDWVGTPAFRDRPWWSRSDGGTVDIKLDGTEENLPASIEIDIMQHVRPEPRDDEVAEIIRPSFGNPDRN